MWVKGTYGLILRVYLLYQEKARCWEYRDEDMVAALGDLIVLCGI